MNSELAERRFRTIHNHLIITSTAGDHDQQSLFHRENAASKFFYEQGFSNALPEELKTGKWNVYRSARSPLKLVSRFADHPEIGTLHDNFVRSVKKFPDCKYLGSRVREDGTVGEYKWITYGEAGTARSAIGSALVCRQIPKGCCVGLYFINRPEWLIVDHACSAYSYISVPLYDTLGPEAVKYIATHAAIGAIFCVPETLNHVSLLTSSFEVTWKSKKQTVSNIGFRRSLRSTALLQTECSNTFFTFYNCCIWIEKLISQIYFLLAIFG